MSAIHCFGLHAVRRGDGGFVVARIEVDRVAVPLEALTPCSAEAQRRADTYAGAHCYSQHVDDTPEGRQRYLTSCARMLGYTEHRAATRLFGAVDAR